MRPLPFLLFIFCSVMLFGEQVITISPSNGDCKHPIEIKDTVLIALNSPIGYGSSIEIETNDKKDLFFFEKEHNTVWYWFRIKEDAQLYFEIIPESISDDYDFLLYRLMSNNFCNDIIEKKTFPIRSCISRNNKLLKSRTGLSLTAEKEFVHSGIGDSFVKSIKVKRDEIYFLLLDNVYSNGKGHKLIFHYQRSNPVIKKGDIVLEVGKSFTFSNIQFYSSQAIFLPEAYPALDSLVQIMTHNPSLKIQIQGHVNAPFEPNFPEHQELSELRAKAVYDYLLFNDISADRMKYLGLGNTRMLYPKAVSEDLMNKNRRVEIKIVSK